MDRCVIEVDDGFWNLRGSYRIGGILELRTHMSLVRRANGRYLVLDACGLVPETRALLDEKTRGGEDLDAFLHLHPFHTLHVRTLQELYPRARLYGTARHHTQLADLPWEPLQTEDPALHAHFAADLDFTIPRGVDLVTPNPRVHFGSVLAIHRATQTLHVDDTLIYARLPWPLRAFGRDVTRFHIGLGSALRRQPGAADAFRSWARELIERAATLQNLCAAHTSTLPDVEQQADPGLPQPLQERLGVEAVDAYRHHFDHPTAVPSSSTSWPGIASRVTPSIVVAGATPAAPSRDARTP